MTARDRILARIRNAASHAVEAPVSVSADSSASVSAEADLVLRFRKEAEDQGVTVQEAAGPEEAAHALDGLLDRLGVETLVCWTDPILEHPAVARVLRKRGLEAVEPPAAGPEGHGDRDARKAAVARADAGVTTADLALADTGTLVLCSAPGRSRSASLLPPVHIALVSASHILPDLPSLLARLPGNAAEALQRESGVILVTGTSKTADIELSLVRGVHGPGEVHVIVLQDTDEA